MVTDETRLNWLMGKFVQDLGAVMHQATIMVCEQPGLCEALRRDFRSPSMSMES